MRRGVKVAFWVLVLAGLGYGQVKYNIGQQALNYVHPQQQAAAPAGGGAAGGAGKRAIPPVAVKLAQSAPKDFPIIERSYGTMASPQVVAINARIASQITQVMVQDGQFVKKGDVLLTLDDRTLQAALTKDEATLAKDQATLVNADSTLERAQTLFSKGVGTKQDVDSGIAGQKAAQQTVDADKAVIDADKLQLGYAVITAPFDGKLGAISAVPGALVAATINSATSGNLMTITQMKPLKVNFRLPEQVLTPLRAKMGDNATVIADSGIVVRVYASDSKELLDTGTLSFVDSAVDISSGTIGMAADVGNEKLKLWPGERVGVQVEYDKIAGAVTVPAVAVQQGQIGSYVWVVDDQNKVKATPVKVARYEGNDAAISDGLSNGQQVVIEGQAKLSNGAEVRVGKPSDGQSSAKPGDAKATDAKTSDTKPADATPKAAPSGAEAATLDSNPVKPATATTGGQTQ